MISQLSAVGFVLGGGGVASGQERDDTQCSPPLLHPLKELNPALSCTCSSTATQSFKAIRLKKFQADIAWVYFLNVKYMHFFICICVLQYILFMNSRFIILFRALFKNVLSAT
jgi:hypothetical protein